MSDAFEIFKERRENYSPIKRWMKGKGMYGYNLWYWMLHPHELVVRWAREQKWKVQRARRGWAISDTWSLDWYLMSWLPDAIDAMREGSMGWPGEGYEDFTTPEEWNELLIKMADGFRAGYKAMEGLEITLPPEWHWAFGMFHKYYWHLWN